MLALCCLEEEHQTPESKQMLTITYLQSHIKQMSTTTYYKSESVNHTHTHTHTHTQVFIFHKLCYLILAHCDGGIFLCGRNFWRLRTIKQVMMHMKCEMDVKLSGLVVDQNLFTDVLLKISNTKLAGFSG